MPIRSRSLLSLLVPLTIACTSEERVCDPAPESPARAPERASATSSEAPAAAEIEIDERAPLPLTQWREIKQKGEAAARVPELDARISQCRAFAKQYPEHQVNAVVLEALADALVEQGGFDAAELARHVEALAKLQPKPGAPTKLVERYHLKHGLASASGLQLLALTRERLAQRDRELALVKDEDSREWMERQIAFDQASAHIAEARLHLRDGQLDLALQAIAGGHAATDRLVKDIVMVDAAGEVQRTLAGGVLEDLHVLAAEVQHRKGDDAAAQAALAQVLGVMEDVEIRRMYDRLRLALVAGAGDDRVVTAAAQPAQDFALKDLAGKTVKLSDYRGKVVLVTFFATWCGPCKLEMPILQKFRAENRGKGVEVLAISIDDFNSRAKIAPFLAKEGIDLPVLLEDPAQLTSYDYSGIPALYVIDRDGNVAHTRTGYDPDLKEKLEHEIQALVEGTGESGRKLLTIERAPAGWGVRWQQAVTGDLQAPAVAPPLAGAGGEFGAVGREGLLRWSADGKPLPARAFNGYTMSLEATDLDGDGKREWIVGGWQDIKVLDHTGELYWEHAGKEWISVAGHRDLNGDGFQELVVRDGSRVVALKAVPEPMWTSAPFKQIDAVRLDPAGGVLVQADGELVHINERGVVTTRGVKAPKGRTLGGRIRTADGAVDLYQGGWDATPKLDQDLDGDGQTDVLLASGTGLIVYDTQGKPLLRVRSHDVEISAAIGDLDGKPGAEVALLVKHYGVVVLGKQD